MRRIHLAATASLVLATLAGCGDDDRPAADGVVGTLVHGWSEEDHDRQLLAPLEGPQLVTDDAERDALLAAVSPQVDTSAVTAVDLDGHVLVLVGHPRCDEHSEVVASGGGTALEARVVQPDPDHPIACEWSPLQVDLWQVDRDEVADDVTLAGAPDG